MIEILREFIRCPFVLPFQVGKVKLEGRILVENDLSFLNNRVMTVYPDGSMIVRDRKDKNLAV